nr:thiamin pyrophosphokinase 1 isoform X2 [Leptinotarsa decemlineata]
MSSIPKYKIWSPFKELMDEIKEESYGILILNSPINFNFDPEFVLRLWNQARVKITVDGGTEKWIQWLASYKFDSDKVPLPDLITGDMDSVPKDVLNKFRGTSTEIIITPNQDETDYVKALREMRKYCTRQNVNVETVYVIADTCGRFDQIIANINALYKSRNILEKVKLFQLASTSLTWLLCEGHHEINIPLSLRSNREWCSLIPIGFPCNVTTTGLQWNLGKHEKCVSTK